VIVPVPVGAGPKKGGHSLHDATSHWLNGNSISGNSILIRCHYFWPGLIALATNTLLFSVLNRYFHGKKEWI
jgi:hypothetical protein